MKKYEIEIKWGLIFAAMMLTWQVLEKILGFHLTSYIMQSIIGGLVTGLIFSLLISIFIKSKNKNHV